VKHTGTFKILSLLFAALFLVLSTSCTSSDSNIIDKVLGDFTKSPLINSVPTQIIPHGDQLTVDINNIRDGEPGTDEGMTYTCYYDDAVNGIVEANPLKACGSLPGGGASFSTGTGTLLWTPATSVLGNYEIKISGSNTEGSSNVIFSVGVRLKYTGVESYDQITGTSAMAHWTANPQAVGYQIFKLNTITGQYELYHTITGGAISQYNLTSLVPNTGYTFRIQAVDNLGNLDGNVVSRSFTTTTLVRISLSPATGSATSGSPITVTAQAYNSDNTPQVVGGLVLTPSIEIGSGTSTGSFSAVTDNNNGTYTFIFTPNVVGTAIDLRVDANVSFYLNNFAHLNINPGPVDPTKSTLTLASASVTSDFSVKATAVLRDAQNNAIPSGITVSFTKTGGTSTGTFDSVNNEGAGVYSINYTGLVAGSAQTITVLVNGTPLSLTSNITVVPGLPVSANSTLVTDISSLPSGSHATITATLKDIHNNPVPSGIFVGFNKTGGTSTGTFGSTTNAGAGVYTTTYQGIVAGTAQTLTVSVNGTSLIPTVAITVIAGPADWSHSNYSLSSNTVISGNFITASLTLRDVNNNLIDSGVTVDFTKIGGTSTGTFNTVSNSGGGLYTIRYTGVTAGTAQNLQVTINGTSFGSALPIQVLNAAPSPTNSTISVSPASIQSGSSSVVTATLRDLNNNLISSGYAVSFSKSGGTSTGTFDSVVNVGSGVYTINYTGIHAGLAQTIGLVVDGTALGPTASITVTTGAPSSTLSTLVLSSNTVVSGQTVTVTATIKDANGNPISSGLTVSFDKTGGTSTGTFSAVSNQGNGIYATTYQGIVAGTAQTIQANVNLAGFGPTQSLQVLVGAPVAVNSTISTSPATIQSGSSAAITATLKDVNNNLISSGYTVSFSKSGGTSTGTFDSVINAGSGVYTVNYTGVQAGLAQTIGLLVDGTALGPTASITVTPGTPSNTLSTLVLSSNTVTAGQTVTATATIKDANGNPISSGLTVGFDKTGGTSTGTFSAFVNQGNGVYTTTYFGVTAGTAQTIQTNVNLAGFGPTQSLQVLVGAPVAANSSLTLGTATVDSASTSSITAVIRDSQNNPINLQYAITFDAMGGTSTGTIGAITNSGTGTFTSSYTGNLAGTAQTIRVLADGVPISGLTASITVTAGPVSIANSVFTIGSNSVQSSSTSNINITLRDSNYNPINYNLVTNPTAIVFAFGGGTSTGTITGLTTLGSGQYSATFNATTMGTPRTIGLTANGTVTGMSITVTVTAGPPTQLADTSPINPVPSIDCNGPYTLSLRDTNNNTTVSTTALTFTLSSSADTTAYVDSIFTDASCSNSAGSSLSLPAYTSSFQFYYKSFQAKNFNLGLAPSVGSIAQKNIPIQNSAVLSWIGASSYFTMSGSGNNLVQDDNSGGFVSANNFATSPDKRYLYVSDNGGNRINKYDLQTNTYIGWIGHVGSVEGITDVDGGTNCAALNPITGDLTPEWCLGGRPNNTSSAALLIGPNALTADAVYLYVGLGSRILRFDQATGAFAGWYGRINTAGVVCTNGTSVASNTTPGWCMSGVNAAGSSDGQFSTVGKMLVYGNYLYAADAGNYRIQRINISDANIPTFEGWVGRILTAPTSDAACAAANLGDPTPKWCYGGTSRNSGQSTNYVTGPPSEIPAPPEGFAFTSNSPISTDGTNLYVGDYNNFRVVRLDLATGAFRGWIGYIYRSSAMSPTAPPQTSGNYTSNWTTGGVMGATSGKGFGYIYDIDIDTTVTPNIMYVTDHYHRVIRIPLDNITDFRWRGRTSASPIGGVVGCSSTPVGGVTPGWCFGGTANSYSTLNGAFYAPYGVLIAGSQMLVLDTNNFRIQRFDKTSGAFVSWIGAGNVSATKWKRTYNAGTVAARAGFDDYSVADAGAGAAMNGVKGNGTNIFQTDAVSARIKKFELDGSMLGYIGQISIFAPTGPAECVGYTSGMTPNWCTGGGRTTTGSGIHGYTNPYDIAADSTYVYIANHNNHRVDRVRISDGLYRGWIGRVSTIPTDGDSGCTSPGAVGNPTPGWCIGGLASAAATNGTLTSPRSLAYEFETATATPVLYIGDSSSRIIKTDANDGSVIGVIGRLSTGTGCTITNGAASGWCASGTGTTGGNNYGSIATLNGIAFNSKFLYAIDITNHRIQRYEKSTGAPAGIIGRIVNLTNLDTSTASFTFAGGPATPNGCLGFTLPTKGSPGWCFSTNNNLGLAMAAGSGVDDGSYSSPRAIWADDNFIYISDSGNSRVVKIDATTGTFVGWRGYIKSITGMSCPTGTPTVGNVTPDWCTGGASGPGKTLGAFDYPTGIWGDSSYVYVVDGHNNRIVAIPK